MSPAFILMSDLHCNYGDEPDWKQIAGDNPGVDILVIAGDTENSVEHAAKIIARAAEHFKFVFVTDGNHEHYENAIHGRTIVESTAVFVDLLSAIPNVAYLSPTGKGNVGVRVGDYRFIGCNGWYSGVGDTSDIEHWQKALNEDAAIGFTANQEPLPFNLAPLHARHLDEMLHGMSVCEPDIKAIVVTHTAPLRDTLMSRPSDPEWEKTTGYYLNAEMRAVIEKHKDRIAVWVHGHTHFAIDIDRLGVRFVVNPRGYGFEKKNWSPVVIDPSDAGDPWASIQTK